MQIPGELLGSVEAGRGLGRGEALASLTSRGGMANLSSGPTGISRYTRPRRYKARSTAMSRSRTRIAPGAFAVFRLACACSSRSRYSCSPAQHGSAQRGSTAWHDGAHCGA